MTLTTIIHGCPVAGHHRSLAGHLRPQCPRQPPSRFRGRERQRCEAPKPLMPRERSFRRERPGSRTRIFGALLGENGRQEGATQEPEPIPEPQPQLRVAGDPPQYFFIIIVSSHPKVGCAYASELTVLALLGIPSILGSFEFKRPPRTAADVEKYMARSPPFHSGSRRFGTKITGVLPEPSASMHAAALVSIAESLRPGQGGASS